MTLKRATVVELIESRPDVQIARMSLAESGASSAKEAVTSLIAYNYLSLGPDISVGQSVLINTTGIDLGLGTGGVAFVVPSEPFQGSQKYGHVIKLRYTPLQVAVDTVEEQDSPHHDLLKAATSLQGMPVVCCELHSQMPLVAAAIKQVSPGAKVAYIMNDAAALPLAFSETVRHCQKAELIDTTISCGQAFGGELEAINLHSALLAAQVVCRAHVALVAPGPGIVGSSTAFGHSGIAQGEALNAVVALEGTPIAPLRLSWADLREEHRALSHHSVTALSRVCLCRALVAVPEDLSTQQSSELAEQLAQSGIAEKHQICTVAHDFGTIDTRGIAVRTMGRNQEQDPAFFKAAFAAGIVAAQEMKSS